MTWNDLAVEAKVLLGYYSEPPSLVGVQVARLMLSHDGPSAEIVIEPRSYPDKPSPRWAAGSNTCQIVLRLIGLSETIISTWSTESTGDLRIVPDGKGLLLTFEGQSSFRLRCDFLQVAAVTGYVNEAA